jgi:hypothetical protein
MMTDFDLLISYEVCLSAVQSAELDVQVCRPGLMGGFDWPYTVSCIALGSWVNVCASGRWGFGLGENRRVDLPDFRAMSESEFRTAVAEVLVPVVRERLVEVDAARAAEAAKGADNVDSRAV